MATMNISLPDLMRNWVQDRVNEGRYASGSDYVRDLIRQDQERSAKIKAMQQAITEGLASGPAKAFDMQEFKSRMTASGSDGDL
ncbi:type II toxin-antitoxin system ParD family antitoxin [Kordiimonas sp.]|uniref:type II toxin-antitoxin system ParD family antitoxin n=1 Tax=Kordiimonas sp. TaxID=1970157 RepID=UPI003A8DC395